MIVTGRRQNLLDDITQARPGIVGLALDVTDDAGLNALTETLRSRFALLNVVIANAGISRPEKIADADWDASSAHAMVDTNIMGVLRIAAATLPLLSLQPSPTFMATSSALAAVPMAAFPTYCATKAFLHSWLQSLRYQMRHLPLEVLELSPPYVQTTLTGAAQAVDPRAMSLAEYTAHVLDMLERCDHPNGEILLLSDLPRRWAERDGTYDKIFSMMNPT